jgi:hypothetical protein
MCYEIQNSLKYREFREHYAFLYRDMTWQRPKSGTTGKSTGIQTEKNTGALTPVVITTWTHIASQLTAVSASRISGSCNV